MVNDVFGRKNDHMTQVGLREKLEALDHSVSMVQKYELLTTNQYLQQMELILDIMRDIQVRMECN